MDATRLERLLDSLPRAPGVYLMKNAEGAVIYVGKAKSLHARVRQYFQPGSSDTRFFVPRLAGIVEEIDVLVTTSEKEALILEANLIKRHTPRYNVRLRDDKAFLLIRLDLDQPWPRLELVRRPRADHALYFGPYSSASAARSTVRTVSRHFRLRVCRDRAFANRRRPCLEGQIGRCLGPCSGRVDGEAYREQVRLARLFLRGRR